jgi:hypothetical protein
MIRSGLSKREWARRVFWLWWHYLKLYYLARLGRKLFGKPRQTIFVPPPDWEPAGPATRRKK